MKKFTNFTKLRLLTRLICAMLFMLGSLGGFSQPTITGPETVPGSGIPATLGSGITEGQVYTTDPGMANYLWEVTPAGEITAGQGTDQITVTWINPISQQSVSVSYTDPNTAVTVSATLIINYYPFLPAIDPTIIRQFVDPLPHFAAGLRVNAKAGGTLQIKTVPVRQIALSTGTPLATGIIGQNPEIGKGNYAAYAISTNNGQTWGPAMWPAQTIEAQQGNPLTVKYINELVGVRYSDFNILADQTLMMNGYTLNGNPLTDPYDGPIPMVVHLHGGEIPSGSDGGPNSWFMPTGTVGVNPVGPGFPYNNSDLSSYPNQQEATTLWYHPHDDGLTRINVYTGLAGYYFLRGADEEQAHLAGWSGDDKVVEVQPEDKSPTFNGNNSYLPEIELGIQDRMFNVNGELYWPVEPTNPELHPFWTPEFVGNVMVVNGKSWPYLSVAPRRYRFRILEGCNARFLNMWLVDAANGIAGPKITVIGGEGGLLATPVELNPLAGQTLLMAPGQRYDVIIDFTGLQGRTFTLMNNANAPYPDGDPVEPGLTDRIMQFVVNGNMVSASNPSSSGTDKSARVSPSYNLRPVNPLVKLTDFQGNLSANVTTDVKRQLVLNEVSADGGPAAVLINNAFFEAPLALPGTPQVFGEVTETPVEGSTEMFQIINISADAHPIHIHLSQWQVVSRQPIDAQRYLADYAQAFGPLNLPGFPAGQDYPGGAGSPFDYNTPNSDGAVGGNLPVTPYLIGNPIPARPEEWGWKDNVMVRPGEVTTLLVRYAPTDKPLNATAAELKYPFDPEAGPGYVWHCHIIDHEDMSMMRPLHVTRSPLREPHFIPVWTGNGHDHMNFYVRTAQHNGVNLQPGDEIGIFDGNVCVGRGILTQVLNGNNTLEIRISRDDPATSAIEGYTSGHPASFKIWDATRQIEVSAVDVTYVSGDNIMVSGATTVFNIGAYSNVEQQIPLLNGWNLFSLYVIPQNPNMLQVMQSLIGQNSLVKVQDEAGNALDLDPSSQWNNQIGNWMETEGYKIKVNASSTLSVTGLPIFRPVEIGLIPGWNIISYPSSVSRDAMEILGNLINSGLLKVQNEAGAAIEIIPGNTGWTNNIGNFDPGEGYKVKVSGAISLSITPSLAGITTSSGVTALLKSASLTAVPEYFKPIYKGNGLDHMNFYLSEAGMTTALKAGNEIGIYDGSYCVGAGVIQKTGDNFYSLAVSADDPTTPQIDGFISGHTPSFRVWDKATDTETIIEAFEYSPGSSRVFEPMASSAIKINTLATGLNGYLEASSSLGDNYPNPFSGETTIPFIIGQKATVDISVFDMLGKKLNTLVHGSYLPGNYTTAWKANDDVRSRVNPGIYICKMIAGEKVYVKLMVVQ